MNLAENLRTEYRSRVEGVAFPPRRATLALAVHAAGLGKEHRKAREKVSASIV